MTWVHEQIDSTGQQSYHLFGENAPSISSAETSPRGFKSFPVGPPILLQKQAARQLLEHSWRF